MLFIICNDPAVLELQCWLHSFNGCRFCSLDISCIIK